MRVSIGQTPRFRDFLSAVGWVLERISPADLLVLPEYWVGTTPLNEEEFRQYISLLSKVAERTGGVVVGGAVAIKTGGVVKNICPVVGSGGVLTYGEKIFPSAATGERERIAGGEKLALFKAGNWTVGCVVCVDLLYPELVRKIAAAGAEVVVNPASIAADRKDLWQSAGLVRAFENSIYVISAVGTGYSYPDGRPVEGGSYVASPNGEIQNFGSAPGIFYATLRREEVEYARARRRYLEDLSRLEHVTI
ncbi:MAG: carbon-nitrogen hydrolase family protein [Pyrobaculum sp.]